MIHFLPHLRTFQHLNKLLNSYLSQMKRRAGIICLSLIYMIIVTNVLGQDQTTTPAVNMSSSSPAMWNDEIVPDILDELPLQLLEINYPSGVKVNNGNELTPTQVRDQPNVTWTSEPNELYTLLMTDPDAPSRESPTFREMRHWLIVNIPENSLSDGQSVSEYVGSGAPQGTGLHRYIFLLFKQPSRLNVTDEIIATKTSRRGRVKFNTREFMAKYNLDAPLAGNFFKAQWDEYVPILKKQFTGE